MLRPIKKLYGPYKGSDGRQRVSVVYLDGSNRYVSYPKWLMEQHLGRELDPDTETIDHIDGNLNNNELYNLRVLDRKQHAIEDAPRRTKVKMLCIWCSTAFLCDPKDRNIARRKKMAGPFCSRRCSGQYGAARQNGKTEKLENGIQVKIEYYKLKDVEKTKMPG